MKSSFSAVMKSAGAVHVPACCMGLKLLILKPAAFFTDPVTICSAILRTSFGT